MAVSNRDRVGRALELLRAGLHPFVDRTMRARKGSAWAHEFNDRGQLKRLPDGTMHLDTPALLRAMDRYWGEVFSDVLDRAHRSLVNELINVRNSWAHDHPFNSADTERALDSAKRLLEAVSAREQAEEIGRAHYEVRRTVFEEEARNKTRYKTAPLEGQPGRGSSRGARSLRRTPMSLRAGTRKLSLPPTSHRSIVVRVRTNTATPSNSTAALL